MKLMRHLILLTLLVTVVVCTARRGVYDTGSKREPDGSRLQIHIVPHSHDDAGWLKTVDQYYWGLRQDIQPAGIQYTLDTIVTSLAANPNRRFTFAEIAFFSRWWRQQDDDTRELVTKFVKEGRLNFVNGGYVQHDEAAAHYVAMVDQTTRGHLFLKNTFGFIPTVGWQIDPFGHSNIQAGLMGPALGFDAVFFGRADYQDMAKRSTARELEHLWRGSGGGPSSSKYDDASRIFTGNFPSGNYGPPPGFWWEWTSSPDPIIADDPELKEYNVRERVDTFVQRCIDLANVTKGRDIMLTMGSDFHYSNAHLWYKNLDKLIHYVNRDGRVNVFYSSPADYVEAKYSYNMTWPVKYDDFFPYADTPHSYWTGYFSSRAASKGYIRAATAYLQAARQLEAYVGRSSKGYSTDALEEAVSICQHHDSITGTARQHVANDYHARIHEGLQQAQRVVVSALSRLLTGGPTARSSATTLQGIKAQRKLQAQQPDSTTLRPENDDLEDGNSSTHQDASSSSNEAPPDLALEGCLWSNVSFCAPTVDLSRLGAPILVVAYNPLAWSRVAPLRVPISTRTTCHWKVFGPEGQEIPVQLIPVASSTLQLQGILSGVNATDPTSAADAELVFEAEIPPLGYTSYVVHPADEAQQVECQAQAQTDSASSQPGGCCFESKTAKSAAPISSSRSSGAATPFNDAVSISNGLVTVEFDPSTGLMSSISVDGGPSIALSAALRWYNSSDGLDSQEDRGQASGAYIFRPNGDYPVGKGAQHADHESSFLHMLQRRGLWGRGARAGVSAVALQIIEGDEVSEVRQIFDDWATLITRLYKGQRHVEVEWTVGPIPFEDGLGREIVLRYSSGIASGQDIYTDVNGRGMQRRTVNTRATWNLNVTEPIAGNYYPVTAAAYIQDKDAQLAVLTDRAQGAASLREGELELMVHRRILVDDRRGVREPLNETACGCIDCDCPGLIVRGVHWLVLSSPDEAASSRRHLQQLLNDPPLLVFGPVPHSIGQYASSSTENDLSSTDLTVSGGGFAHLRRTFSITNDRIMHHASHLLTLMRPSANKLLVRIAHLFDDGEDPKLGVPTTEDVGSLLEQFHCEGRPVELTLSGNQRLKDAEERRLRFRAGRSMNVHTGGSEVAGSGDEEEEGGMISKAGIEEDIDRWLSKDESIEKVEGSWRAHLNPMEVRTYEVDC